MATFYWVGGAATAASGMTGMTAAYTNPLGNFAGTTGTQNLDWILAFDWNNPRNWREVAGLPGHSPMMATRSPGPNDIAVFGATGFGLNVLAPCLWGGVSAGSTGFVWRGAGDYGAATAGTSFASSLAKVEIQNFNNRNVSDPSAPFFTGYPFANIGYGYGLENLAFTQSDLANFTTGSHYNPIMDAVQNGFTLGNIIWASNTMSELVDALIASTADKEPLGQLRLVAKFVQIGGMSITGGSWNAGSPLNYVRNKGRVDIQLLKSIQYFSGSTGTSGGFFVDSQVNSQGYHELIFRGYARQMTVKPPVSSGVSFANANGVSFAQIGYQASAPRGILTCIGATVGSLTAYVYGNTANLGSIGLDTTSNVGEFRVPKFGARSGGLIQLQNRFGRAEVLADLGTYTSTAGGNTANVPNVYIGRAYSSVTSMYDSGFPSSFRAEGVVIGNPGATVSANWMEIGEGAIGSFSTQIPLPIQFGGSAVINKLSAYASKISGWATNALGTESGGGNALIPLDSSVKIHTLDLKGGSEIDFHRVRDFDNWEFGVQQGDVIIGGIVNTDGSESPQSNEIIYGSRGLRLWNDTQILGGNFADDGAGTRGGKVPPTLSSGNIAF